MAELRPEMPFSPKVIEVNTLSGIIDYIRAGVDDEKGYVIHIADYNKVYLYGVYNPEFCISKLYIAALSDLKRFCFREWLDHESFIISALSFFRKDGDNNDFGKLMSFLNQVRADKVVSLTDDGIAQQVAVKTGVVSLAAEKVPNPVSLVPYETFPEIEEIPRSLVFRIREKGAGIECALFESGDTRWKLNYIQAVKAYFEKNFPAGDKIYEEVSISIIA